MRGLCLWGWGVQAGARKQSDLRVIWSKEQQGWVYEVDRYLLSTYCLPDLRLGTKETSMSDTGKESGPHGAGFPGEGEIAHGTPTPVSVTHALAHMQKRTLPLSPRHTRTHACGHHAPACTRLAPVTFAHVHARTQSSASLMKIISVMTLHRADVGRE